jgi:hypothetical protein
MFRLIGLYLGTLVRLLRACRSLLFENLALRRLSTFIKTCRSERKAGENQQVVTTSDQLFAPSSSPLRSDFATICHN